LPDVAFAVLDDGFGARRERLGATKSEWRQLKLSTCATGEIGLTPEVISIVQVMLIFISDCLPATSPG
jgi:hypothetical protein